VRIWKFKLPIYILLLPGPRGVPGPMTPASALAFCAVGRAREGVDYLPTPCGAVRSALREMCLVAGGIYNLMKTLRETYRVNSVVVFEVLERDEPAHDCRWMKCTSEAYNEKVQSLNETPKTWCAVVPGITFRKHRKDAKRLGDDGIHIREIWIKNYWRSIEQANVQHLLGHN